jgi:acyl-CoA thioester hydrolase
MSELEVKIYYEDTDCGGVIYHANYLRYFERARTEFFAERGISVRDLVEQGIIFVVAWAEISYEAPGQYGDVLVVESKIEQAKRVSFLFSHVVRKKGDDTVLVRAKIKLGCVNGERRPTRLPASILSTLSG